MEQLTKEDLRELIRETVRETMIELGVNADDALEMQRDFGFLRDFRKARDSMTAKALSVAVGVLITATLGAIAMGIKNMIVGN